ncbi:hypothetical protein B0A54_06181 [Friedmanniomyces endolithicus]|uniref:Peptidyl-prolyl cis-trans isomerase n=1 Tax=Friedmanniomyces endolithicus TaxID=329885 RepID=A0A4V5N7W9_9PEZI|nr:hypothetical protein B0A54_06181 [Friedmanniomyces endolithicus]
MAETVVLETSMGNITCELYTTHAPRTCQNFSTLASRNYYNRTVFHRIIPDFMVQGGDPTGTGRGGATIWATMSARVGSITDNRLGGWYSYRASKAAVNQIIKTFDNHLRTSAGEKALAVSLHPGTVKTGLSEEFWGNVKGEKLFSAEFSAEKLMEVLCGRTVEDRGKCWDWKGDEVPP